MLHELIVRNIMTDKQVLGNLFVFDSTKVIFQCKTLELPWNNNERQISCIPQGVYTVEKYSSMKYPIAFHIKNVPNRDAILQHNGNYTHQILGCQLVGDSHTDIDQDGLVDVTNSRNTLKKYFEIMPFSFQLKIVNAWV